MTIDRRQFLKAASLSAVGAALASRLVAAEAKEPKREMDAPKSRKPNIVVFLLDDMGFSDVGCYGGEIETPNLDALAANGLRFTNFYNTGRCWPTRACITTGYYAQAVRMDPVKGTVPKWVRFLPQYLKPAGYRSYMTGKWHIRPVNDLVAGAGFDEAHRRDDTDHHFIQGAAGGAGGEGLYAATKFADDAIGYLDKHARDHKDQPFFLYVAFTEPHFPLHAPREDIARYRERYLEGWDVARERRWKRLTEMGIVNCALPPLETSLKAPGFQPRYLEQLGAGETDHAAPWRELTPEQQRFQAAKMAVHAAMVHRVDREIGRVVEKLKALGALEDTAIFFLSDNGASAEILIRADGHDPQAVPGSAKSFLCLGPGWSACCNAPLRRHKIWVHEGGISTPLIVHWPAGFSARGELRRDMGHVVDFVPTALELAGATPAKEWNGLVAPPLHGRSLVPAFAGDGKVSREHLYFNHSGNRALRMGNWKIVSASRDGADWALHDLAANRSEMRDFSAGDADRKRGMIAKWEEVDAELHRLAGGT
jgi:arylsulfatase